MTFGSEQDEEDKLGETIKRRYHFTAVYKMKAMKKPFVDLQNWQLHHEIFKIAKTVCAGR